MTSPFPLSAEARARKVSIGSQLAEVRRELAMRDQVYPHLVHSGKLRQAEAEYNYAALMAAGSTLEWVQRHAEELRKGQLVRDIHDFLGMVMLHGNDPAKLEASVLRDRVAKLLAPEAKP